MAVAHSQVYLGNTDSGLRGESLTASALPRTDVSHHPEGKEDKGTPGGEGHHTGQGLGASVILLSSAVGMSVVETEGQQHSSLASCKAKRFDFSRASRCCVRVLQDMQSRQAGSKWLKICLLGYI